MATTADLTIIKPGKKAEAIMADIERFVTVDRKGKTSATLTFEHANALAAAPVLATYLRRQGFEDWERYVTVSVEFPKLVGVTVPR